MKNTFPSYFKKFVCIADKCPDTCCAGWDVVIDSESLEKYEHSAGAYAEKIRSLITTDSDGDCIFISHNKKCPFLLESGLCEMYTELGHENLCRTCRFFPRFINSFGARIETGISLSCPEAARLIFEDDSKLILETEETNSSIIPADFDAELYFTLLNARKKAIDILQCRKFSIERRICAFLEFSQDIQQCIKRYEYDEIAAIGTDEYLEKSYVFSPSKCKHALRKIFSDYSSLEYINSDYSDLLLSAETVDIKGFSASDDEYEQLLIYFVFRYFITAAYDGDLLTKSKLAAVSFITVNRIHAKDNSLSKNRRVELCQKYSKEIEHCQNNIDFMLYTMKKSRYYSVENLTNILSEKENI